MPSRCSTSWSSPSIIANGSPSVTEGSSIGTAIARATPMKLSVLDQSPVSTGSTPAQALQNSIELARLADELGYTRYWIAEHHATEALASPAPEVLIARVGAETVRIRIGSGGVMLPHYSPLK